MYVLSRGTTVAHAGPHYRRPELCTRCQAILDTTSVFEYGPLRLDLRAGQVLVDGEPRKTTLAQREFLAALMRQPGKVMSHRALHQVVSDPTMTGQRIVDVHLYRLRKAIRPHQGIIQTVWGVGVRLGESLESTHLSALGGQ